MLYFICVGVSFFEKKLSNCKNPLLLQYYTECFV